jgi:hypothetical protein
VAQRQQNRETSSYLLRFNQTIQDTFEGSCSGEQVSILAGFGARVSDLLLGGVVEPPYVEITIFGCVASYTDEGLIGYTTYKYS